MHIVLWDTRKLDVSKDFAGGFGVGQYPGYGGLRGRLIRRCFTRDWRPVGLLYAHLAAIFRRLGHTVQYVLDRTDVHADLYVFCPSLITLDLEREAIAQVRKQAAPERVLVVGTVASVMPEAFAELGVTVVKGEAEQLLWKLDDVLARPGARSNSARSMTSSVAFSRLVAVRAVAIPHRPTISGNSPAPHPAERGCAFHCNYAPYLVLEWGVRHRSPSGRRRNPLRDRTMGLRSSNSATRSSASIGTAYRPAWWNNSNGAAEDPSPSQPGSPMRPESSACSSASA